MYKLLGDYCKERVSHKASYKFLRYNITGNTCIVIYEYYCEKAKKLVDKKEEISIWDLLAFTYKKTMYEE